MQNFIKIKDWSNAAKVSISILVTVLYIVLFFPLYNLFGPTVTAFVVFPVIVFAFFFGVLTGAIAGVISFGLNAFFLTFTADHQPEILFGYGGLTGHFLIFVLGIIAGWMSNQSYKLTKHIDASRRIRERIRHRNRELAALNNTITDILERQSDLPLLLQTILKRAVKLLDATGGDLGLFDEEKYEVYVVTSFNMGKDFSGTRHSLGEGAMGKVAETGKPIIIPDYREWEGRSPKYADGPWHAVMAAPLKAQDRLIGAIGIVHTDPERKFTRSDLWLLELFARQAAIAVDNARLLESEREQRRLAQALQESGAALSSILDTNTLLDTLLSWIGKVVPYDAANVMMIEEKHARVVRMQGYNRFGKEVEQRVATLSIKIEETPNLRTMIETREPLIISDTLNDPEWMDYALSDVVRSWAGAPILVQGEVKAFFSLDNTKPGFYHQEHSHRLKAFAGEAGLALHNAQLFAQIQHQASTDPMTGLYNSRFFFDHLEKELQRSRRYSHKCSLIMIDLDDFKKYNDQYGHLAGDDLLKKLAELIKSVLRDVDVPARYGGDEFVILLPETGLEEAGAVAKRLSETVRRCRFITYDGRKIGRITVSLGIAEYSQKYKSTREFMEAADRAMFYSKEGKDRISVAK